MDRFSDLEVPDIWRGVVKKEFCSLQKSHNIVQYELPLPRYDNSFPVEGRRLFIAMEYLMTSLEVHVVANHGINMEGHIFTNLPIYERVGKIIAVCFENYQHSIF